MQGRRCGRRAAFCKASSSGRLAKTSLRCEEGTGDIGHGTWHRWRSSSDIALEQVAGGARVSPIPLWPPRRDSRSNKKRTPRQAPQEMTGRNLPRIVFVVAAAAMFGSFTGFTIAKLISATSPDYLSAISSIGSFGAAIAAFLTLREMRSARRLSARARIGLRGSESPARFQWDLAENHLSLPDGTPTLAIRNSNEGTANSVTMSWRAETRISVQDIEAINSILPQDRKTEIGQSTYEVVLFGRERTTLPIAGMDKSILGDVGPAQEQGAGVPAVIFHYAIVKWMALLERSLRGGVIAREEVPRFVLAFSHSNPYESNVVDTHEVRFVMVALVVRDAQGHELNRNGWQNASRIEATIAAEIWVEDPEASPTIVVGGIG